ncbi:hypothetical protein BDV23DRAFT_156389 [Aspergillus alliaceus]|uniref:Uncharacterized protein n=1 Tax=Petromyces alliaceus TaxID=209559 RepID=A0A5N7C714_PETAA|nr:hypothetical protein BDV23DRAFT_156389 [Aspergillus alliaceus]
MHSKAHVLLPTTTTTLIPTTPTPIYFLFFDILNFFALPTLFYIILIPIFISFYFLLLKTCSSSPTPHFLFNPPLYTTLSFLYLYIHCTDHDVKSGLTAQR